ncbi:hypothetical protein GUITHDRAFT_119828 [Guillardia theta CCMP2712]|uniref:Amine oxidase domain-containing protein n=1 Tax=Guillardia theta (strain CCMP2712) TaxID=905079 RepID=L1ICI8_GUITC|nr:hypothetical protein GUITHDRAFT_119828 [Guillardia theta CCMP2712]EKX33966.1 hypothetical protein GUITHDRAFT_119828 [Guillardia theta CCMP2712]|eukprot:XP_005820946.1 hypothetical protein GUITHDRAFT_119828 [Guillardia theta CCMP2712]
MTPGASCEVYEDGDWWKAKVVQVRGGRVLVKFVGSTQTRRVELEPSCEFVLLSIAMFTRCQEIAVSLHSKVTRIVVEEKEQSSCRVEFVRREAKEKKEQKAADFVIVTLPLGVLQASAVSFSPPLPDEKLQAIHALGMGVENKVILRFSRCFWPKDVPYLQCIHPCVRFLNGHFFGKEHTLIAHLSPPLSHADIPDELLLEEVLRTCSEIFSQSSQII